MIFDPLGTKQRVFKRAIQDKNYEAIKKILSGDIEWLYRPLYSANDSLLSHAANSEDAELKNVVKNALENHLMSTKQAAKVLKNLVMLEDIKTIDFLVTKDPNFLDVELSWEHDSIDFRGSLLHYASLYNKVQVIDYLLAIPTIQIDLQIDSRTPLLLAARFNATEAAVKLIKKGANPLLKANKTPLNWAISNNNEQLVDLMLAHPQIDAAIIENASNISASPNYVASKGCSLLKAIETGDLVTVKKFTEQNPEWLNVTLYFTKANTTFESYPLHIAAAYGHIDIIDYIIQIGKLRGYDAVNFPTSIGNMPLHFAARFADERAVQKLFDKGAIVNALVCGWSALQLAATYNRKEVVDLLIARPEINAQSIDSAEANITRQDNHITNKKAELLKVIQMDDVEALKDFVKQNPEWLKVTLKWDRHKGNVLHCAARHGSSKIIEYVGSELINSRSDSWTPLHFAAMSGKLEVAEWLIEQGADIIALTKESCSPLAIAAGYNHGPLVESLLNHPNINAEMIEIASITAFHRTPNYLRSKKAQLVNAIKSANLAEIQKFVAQNPEWLKVSLDNSGATALHLAILSGNHSLITWIMHQQKIELMELLKPRDKNGLSPLDYAALTNNEQLFTEMYKYNERNNVALKKLFIKAKKDQAEIFEAMKDAYKINLEKIAELEKPKVLLGMEGVTEELAEYLKNNFGIQYLHQVADSPSYEKLLKDTEKFTSAQISRALLPKSKTDKFQIRLDFDLLQTRFKTNKKIAESKINSAFLKIKTTLREQLSVLKLNLELLPVSLFTKECRSQIKEPCQVEELIHKNPTLIAEIFNDKRLFTLLKNAVSDKEGLLEEIILNLPASTLVKQEAALTWLIASTRSIIQKLFGVTATFISSFIDKLERKNSPQSNFVCGQFYKFGLLGKEQDLAKAAQFFNKIPKDNLTLYLQAQMELANIYSLPNEQGMIAKQNIKHVKSCWVNIIVATPSELSLTAEEKQLREDALNNLICVMDEACDVDLQVESQQIKEMTPAKDAEGNFPYVEPQSVWKKAIRIQAQDTQRLRQQLENNSFDKTSLYMKPCSFWAPIDTLKIMASAEIAAASELKIK